MTDLASGSAPSIRSEHLEPDISREAERRVATALGISFDGRYYRYKGYRYDGCADAIDYARLDRSRSPCSDEEPGQSTWNFPPAPTEEEQKRMAEYCITFDGRYYRYAGYRYDGLDDAVRYSALKR
jgi:hypothetical protein